MGIEGGAVKKNEAPVVRPVETPQAVPIRIVGANDNQSQRPTFVERSKDFALKQVAEMREGGLKDRFSSLAWNLVDKDKLSQRVGALPDGQAKDWWANYATKKYGEEIEVAQANALASNAQLSALGPSDAAGMRQALRDQNAAIGKIDELAKKRSEYAGILKNRFDSRLGDSKDPQSPRGRAAALEVSQESRGEEIEKLAKALGTAKQELKTLQQAQVALMEKRAFGNPAEAAESELLLDDILKRIHDSEERLGIMTREQDAKARELDKLSSEKDRLEAQLKQWSSVQENGKYGTLAMERIKAQVAPTVEVEPSKAVATEEMPATNSGSLDKVAQTAERSERLGTLASIAALLLEELEMGKLRGELRKKLDPLGAENLKEGIPAAMLVNVWNAYADNSPKTDTITERELRAISGGDATRSLTLEDFGVEVAKHTEMKHNKVIDGMDKVAMAMKKKLDAR